MVRIHQEFSYGVSLAFEDIWRERGQLYVRIRVTAGVLQRKAKKIQFITKSWLIDIRCLYVTCRSKKAESNYKN